MTALRELLIRWWRRFRPARPFELRAPSRQPKTREHGPTKAPFHPRARQLHQRAARHSRSINRQRART